MAVKVAAASRRLFALTLSAGVDQATLSDCLRSSSVSKDMHDCPSLRRVVATSQSVGH